ncbi:MAG: aldehyde dehydrogenase [Candidatus Izemoplasmatales bacterium]|jgi:aldehyde dehydrogenase (NAD+)|nr:aldehyde dehydrogenase [Candidatus Izemoplasmatales bacterium]
MIIKELVQKQRNYFNTHVTKTYEYRKEALNKLYDAIVEYEDEIKEALYLDLHKSPGEAYLTEIGVTLKEIKYQIKHLKKMMKNKRVRTELTHFPAKSFISPAPYGVVLIMSPWNYPIFLTLAPLAGAMAAGNTVVIKPSNYSSNTSDVIEKIISSTFENEYIAVVKGGREENQDLLNQKFNYIFFTGSTEVAKIVMEKAAKNLTPVSLELGGKSPTVVTRSADIDLTAKRIVFGKLINVGQTCVAPDYILADQLIEKELIEKLIYYIKEFYGDNPLNNQRYGKIINKKHFERLLGLIPKDKIAYGGGFDEETLKIQPTILKNITADDSVMQEEIFGPILPVLTYENIDEAVDFVNDRPHPLAFYLFTTDKATMEDLLNRCQAGGGCINDTIMQVASDYLPFGGVGDSGMGSYHGKKSFETFTHYRSVIKKSNVIDIPLRYFPVSDKKEKFIKKILK